MTRHRSWCFTTNNFSPSDWLAVKYLFKSCIYGICGEEVGANGTAHLQGYFTLVNPLSLQVLKKTLGRSHLEVSLGSARENQTYCSKEQTNIYEVGTCPEQGSRNDIKELAQKIKNLELTLEDCMFEYPELYVRYSRSLEKMFNAVATPRSTPPEVHWRWGLSGTGKTRYCIEKHPSHYIKDGTSWWDNYKAEEAIIIDDYENTIPFRILLRMLDRYTYQGQIKGGYVQINSPYIYITCEFPPEHFFQGNELAQVTRRLTSVQQII